MPKTKIQKTNYYENRNTSDILSRLVILGLLRVLNMKLIYTQVWGPEDKDVEKIIVPFFYDFSGGAASSERFIQDNYMNWTDDECTEAGIKKMDGDYKPIPYGVITLNSSSIDASNISNRFVMGKYTKREAGEIRSYVSFLYSIPLTYSFQCSIKCDNVNTMWKIEQAFREYFYKNKTFHVNYKGMSVPVRCGFAESLSAEKNAQYTMGQSNDGDSIKLTFDIQCETYQPVFDPYNERPADNYIKHFTFGIDTRNNDESKMKIIPVSDFTGKVAATQQDIVLEWRNNYTNSDLMYIDIVYKEEGSDVWNLIDTVENHNFYHWIIPDNFIESNVEFDLIIQPTSDIIVHTPPTIKIYPNPKTSIIDDSNVIVVSKGMFFTEEPECQLPIIISYIDKDGEIQDISAALNLKNNMVDESHPVCISPFIYNGEINSKKIEVAVRDHHNPNIITSFINNPEDTNNWLTIC